MRPHISKISSTCYYHLRRLRKLRFILDSSTMQRLVSALILSRVDYCNAVLAGLPAVTLKPLQRVLNAAARLVAGLGRYDHITEVMKSLHWLPVAYRIKFKLCLLMHAVVNGQCPAYIDDIVTPTSTFSGRANSRSTAMRVYDVPRVRTKFGERAFSVAGPREWNARTT